MSIEEKKPHNRIAELRKEKHLTIQQLADEIGVANGTISRYEKGSREPKLETWMKLADFFDVPISYITGASNEPNKDTGRLQNIREDKGMSYQQVADAYNQEADGIPTFGNNEKEKHISAQTIEDIENGKYQPGQHEWQLLAWALNVPEFYLSGRSNDKVGWQEWAEATGHPVEQIEKERQRLIDTKRLDKNLDIQYQIDYAIKSLEQNVPTTTNAAIGEVSSELSKIRHRIYENFLEPAKPISKLGKFTISHSNGKVRQDMDENVYRQLIDIVNKAQTEVNLIRSKK